jgi:HD-GYP domain-containing protein (c-di-GMP phosphodiesterase class II)
MIRSARKFPLYVYIAALFLALILAFAAVSITREYVQIRQIMLSDSEALFRHIDSEAQSAILGRYGTATFAADLLSTTTLAEAATLPDRLKNLPFIVRALQDQGAISAAYMAYANGDFFLVRRLESDSWLWLSMKPPPSSAFLVQSLDHNAQGQRQGHYLFFDMHLRILEDRAMPEYNFDPRGRPWYAQAMQGADMAVTVPYLFFTTREIGTTFARRSADGTAVAGVDLTLDTLSALLRSMRPTPSAELAILNEQGELLADADSAAYPFVEKNGTVRLPKISELDRRPLASVARSMRSSTLQLFPVETPKGTWEALVSPLPLPGLTLYLAVTAPQRELLAQADRIRNRSLFIALGAAVVTVVLTLLLSRLASKPIAALSQETKAIRQLKFDRPIAIRSSIAEIDALARSMTAMKSTIQRFLNVGAALAEERRFDRLLDRILVETIRVASARGGMIYLTEPDGRLKCALARWDDKIVERDRADLDATRDKDHPVVRAAAGGALTAMMTQEEFDRWYPGFAHRDALATLAVPLKSQQEDVVGVLMLSQDPETLTGVEERDELALVEAVSGTAAAAIETQRLLHEQKLLLDAFIELVAGAIDRKSPYTGSHCQRVPELTKMIARAAQEATHGPFKDFALDEAQWEELHIAAWLHDCGKVTTPEFVVDKATKLEAIYDRLHEVRMRFEVIKREAEVACWKAIADGAGRDSRLAELDTLWAALDEEFAFVAASNEGGEEMAPEKLERLREIARRRWTRTLDDRLGLSREERLRKARVPAVALPAVEPLLADRPDHILERPEQDRIAPDNRWGFKVDVPANLYNRGEIYNLGIARGTLTPEDRYKINEHMIETIRMLSRLPLPRHLRNVVEIAGGHHEKMDGTGYPRRLRREQMSLPARMMAVADIFEALTAGDRPYKKAKTLSESLSIMARMRDESHIDPDIFDLFLSAGVYSTYARRFLKPEQIDAIDPARFRRAG